MIKRLICWIVIGCMSAQFAVAKPTTVLSDGTLTQPIQLNGAYGTTQRVVLRSTAPADDLSVPTRNVFEIDRKTTVIVPNPNAKVSIQPRDVSTKPLANQIKHHYSGNFLVYGVITTIFAIFLFRK